MISEMALGIESARLLMHKAAYLRDIGEPFGTASAMAKLHASEVAVRTTDKAVQIHGGIGYMREYPIERYYRDAKATLFCSGTSELQREVISQELLGS
jgi:alkylation response protein AidB-like acyl-CoA dehydrogenase